MLKKFGLATTLMSIAGVAIAGGDSSGCINFWFFEYCRVPSPTHPAPVTAPEIDPASGLAGLSLLVGGLAVISGRVKARA